MQNYIKQHFDLITKEECEIILKHRIDYSLKDNKLNDLIIFKDEADSIWKPIIEKLQLKTKSMVQEYLKNFLGLFPESYVDVSHVGFLNDKFGSFTEIHYDWEMVILKGRVIPKPFVILIYLNDDFKGGDLLFPLQEFKTIPKQGSAVIFPCNFAFPHVSQPVTEGSKHLCRITFKVDPDHYKVDFLEI